MKAIWAAAWLRPLLVGIAMSAIFLAIAIKGALVAVSGETSVERFTGGRELPRRADILDRNGELLATSVTVYSLFADPRAIWSAQEVVAGLVSVFPDLDAAATLARLSDRKRAFTWVRRGLTPRQREAVLNLELEGLGFREELRRAYPRGTLAGHALGYAGVDGQGLSGLEYSLNARLLEDTTPVRLTLDSGVQFVLEAELASAAKAFQVSGAAGLVLEAKTGAVRALASWPALDPNRPPSANSPAALDRTAGAVFELGSIFKPLTVANGIEIGALDPAAVFDLSQPVVFQGFEVRDLHPIQGPANLFDIIAQSSNKGVALIASAIGVRRQQAFLEALGLLERAPLELPASARPLVPDVWDTMSLTTISYGHGIAVTPIAFASAFSVLANKGEIVAPTLLEEGRAVAPARRVMSALTADLVNAMLREAVVSGTGRRADVLGYRIAGKTGTAEKPVPGGYDDTRNVTSFAALFPVDSPEYVVLIVLDEPRKGEAGGITAGWNAAPIAGRVIERIAPLLGVLPRSARPGRPAQDPAIHSVAERRAL